jgi:hypothetical protein
LIDQAQVQGAARLCYGAAVKVTRTTLFVVFGSTNPTGCGTRIVSYMTMIGVVINVAGTTRVSVAD